MLRTARVWSLLAPLMGNLSDCWRVVGICICELRLGTFAPILADTFGQADLWEDLPSTEITWEFKTLTAGRLVVEMRQRTSEPAASRLPLASSCLGTTVSIRNRLRGLGIQSSSIFGYWHLSQRDLV